GIEMETDPIAALVHERLQLDERPARMNVRLAPHATAARLSADLRSDVEPVDPQFADMDIEAGKDRSLLGARLELGQADERHSLRRHAVDVELVVEPCSRRPVELDVRGGQEGAVLIGDGDVAQLRLAEDRPFDPADMDAQARGGLKPADLGDNERVG